MASTMKVDGKPRWIVPVSDNDGIVLLLDEQGTARRYADAPFDYDVDGLRTRCGTGELVAFGTHGGVFSTTLVLAVAEFSPGELEENGMIESLDGGVLILSSDLVVTDWAQYTMGCDYNKGSVEGERVSLPHGKYRVTIHRSYGADDDQPGFIYLVELGATSDAPTVPEELPGNDGYF